MATEEHLKLACVMPQGMGISGITFCGTDVGGFFGSPTPESLYPLDAAWCFYSFLQRAFDN